MVPFVLGSGSGASGAGGTSAVAKVPVRNDDAKAMIEDFMVADIDKQIC